LWYNYKYNMINNINTLKSKEEVLDFFKE